MYEFKMNETSIDEWFEICEFQPPVGYQKIDTPNSIIIISNDDLLKICNYLKGNKEIPSIHMSEDILGDIEEGDLSCDEWTYGYGYNCTVEDLDGIVDTRGVFNHHWSIPKFSIHKDINGEYFEDRYPLRKGYPSFFMKNWD